MCCRSTAARATGRSSADLKRGTHVVVGTPGRVIDHLERGSLDLSQLTTLVLDEADEMLRMGFIDDVEAVLKKTPPTRQIALFSATMPTPIRRIAQTYLRDPIEISIKSKTTTGANIRQRYWWVSGLHKLDALTRILEAETFDAMLVFTRTKQATEELAEKLQARGFSAAAINGDIVQAQRERTIQQLQGRQARHPGRDRRRRARARRRAHQPRAELRHSARHRRLRAPHRPHRPRRTQRRGDPVRHAAREAPAADDRARDAPADRGDAAAERRSRQRQAHRRNSSSASATRSRRASSTCSSS